MKKTNSIDLLIKGGKPAYGEVTMSNDSHSAVIFISNFIASRRSSLHLNNVPRTKIVMDYVDLLESLGAKIEWTTIKDIFISIPDNINTDITSVDSRYFYFLKVLIPSLLIRKRHIVLNKTISQIIRDEMSFYDNIGINIFYNLDKKITLRVPLDMNPLKTIHLKPADNDLFKAASQIILSQTFKNIRIGLNQYDPRISRLFNLDLKQNANDNTINNLPSITEFNFFACISTITDGEVEFKNFDLGLSLPFLLKLVELGANYEVVDYKLKFWYEHKGFEMSYVYDHIALDEIGYILLIVSSYTSSNVKFRIPKKTGVEDLVRELNILGCKIDHHNIAKGKIEYSEIIIKPSKTISVKGQFEVSSSFDINMVVLAAAFANEGKSRISDFQPADAYMENFLDNLNNINLDIVATTD